MTYGEYYYLIKCDMKLIDGTWVAKKPNSTIPMRMSKPEALLYYTLKLRAYWDEKSLSSSSPDNF